jgi:hypothetical protein
MKKALTLTAAIRAIQIDPMIRCGSVPFGARSCTVPRKCAHCRKGMDLYAETCIKERCERHRIFLNRVGSIRTR